MNSQKPAAGTEEDAAAYFAEAWWPSGRGGVDCEVVAGRDADVFAYQCACGNGFWCGANTALPKFCPKGYFCETPASLEKCPEGSYCKEGSVEAAKCSNLQDCPKGSAVPEATASARRRPPSVGSGRGAGRAARGREGARSGARTSEALGVGPASSSSCSSRSCPTSSSAGQDKGDSTSLQHECSAHARSGNSIHASRPFREMIARPKISRNEWKTAEI